jgi:CRISPR-associated endonuclease/helicase Cas3
MTSEATDMTDAEQPEFDFLQQRDREVFGGGGGMNTTNAYAHSLPGRPPEEWQLLKDHLRAVAAKAAGFAKEFGSSDWGWNAGWLHDTGKAADEFQRYLLRENGLDDSEYDEGGSGRVNHSSAGAALAEERFSQPKRPMGRPLAYVAAGHHAGLPDWYTSETGNAALSIRLQKDGRRNLEQIRPRAEEFARNLRMVTRLPQYVKEEQFHLWVRMLFSCLTDADSLDTEVFMQPEKASQRMPFPSLTDLKARLDAHLGQLTARSQTTSVNEARRDVLAACRAAALSRPGMFSLTVPTGGGKTLSRMAFALDHAIAHGKRRVIYVIPYTSIIEQTGNTLAEVFGRENIVEHHSNLDPDKETLRSKLASENWDAPVVITTNVQFFESLYSARPGRCRKLHNIVNSVVILDEAQMLPPELLTPCVDVMNQLVRHYGVTIVLATATQPALPGLDAAREIVPDPPDLYARLKRTRYVLPTSREPTTWEVLASRLVEHDQVLCVVNSRKDCHDLFRLMPKGTVHLSALMCGEHRSQVIADIKQHLKKDSVATRVISTQLVEAGVDMDFPVVYRAWAGLDSIAQAAGRCNREGRLNELGEVHVFEPPKRSRPGLLRKKEDTAQELLDMPDFDLEQPDAFARYFGLFYRRVNDTGAGILKDLTPDQEHLAMAFRTVGDRFQLIKDDDQRPVFVHYDTVSDELLKALQFGGPNRDVLRRLQRYVVNLHAGQFAFLQRDIVEVRPGFWVWNGHYSKRSGVDVFGDGPSAEECIISEGERT